MSLDLSRHTDQGIETGPSVATGTATAMHILVIAILICLLLPAVGRLLGSIFKAIFWMILALLALTAVGTFVG